MSLSTRLFLSFFLVSATLFGGIFFYLKGYHSRMEEHRATVAFERAIAQYHNYRDDLERLSAVTGIQHLRLRTSPKLEAEFGSFALSIEDLQRVESIPPDFITRTKLTTGNYLVKAPSSTQGDGWRLVLLFPLQDFENASRELLEAFLMAGLALLLLITVFSQLLAQEISRPLTTLRDRVRMIGSKIGIDPPEDKGDEIRGIAKSYLDVANQLQLELDYRKLALDELEETKGELLQANSRLRSRLFQVKVLLSLWNQQENAQDVKHFLSNFLEVLLPGLPFEYGCVIIRPLAEMESEVVFARVDRFAKGEEKIIDDEVTDPSVQRDRTQWTGIVDPRVKEFLLRESQACMTSSKVIVGSLSASVSKNGEDCQVYVMSIRLKRGDEPLGSLHFLAEKNSPPLGELFFEFLVNLSNQVAAQLQIHALSYATRLDPLTRLYNRGYLHDRLREEAMRATRTRSPFSLLILDIDHFIGLNHSYGQQAGDEVLRGLATLLKRTCRGSDAVCRYSATEIAIILADTPLSGAKIFAENLRKSVEAESFLVPNGTLQITVSMGVAESPAHGANSEELIRTCEIALKNAKEGGRNTWKVPESA